MIKQEEYFIECCFNNDLKTIKTLVKHNVDISVSGYWGHRIAANNGFMDLLKYLYSIDNNHELISKSHILSGAATKGQLSSVEFIISQSDSYKNDSSTLQWTAAAGNIEMMTLLIPYCTYFDYIFFSAAKNRRAEMLKFLLDNEMEKFDKQFNADFVNAILYGKK